MVSAKAGEKELIRTNMPILARRDFLIITETSLSGLSLLPTPVTS